MKVLILLSTYNGERYLREQLDSLYSQVGIDIHILVRDDGSKDTTLSILEEYRRTQGKMTIIKGENKGVGPSFFALICEATANYGEYDFYAFCDQDDVWFNNKVITGAKTLKDSKGTYKLFFSSAINTDSNLNPISKSRVKVVNSFGANLVANHILGCTMLMNAALLREVNKINICSFEIPDGLVPIHDGWTASVAYALGATVIQNTEGLMYYRQHGNNVVGSGSGFWTIQKKRIERYLTKTTHVKSNRCIISLQVLGDGILPQNRRLLELVACYRNSVGDKIHLLFDKRMYEYGLIDNIGTFLTLTFNKF